MSLEMVAGTSRTLRVSNVRDEAGAPFDFTGHKVVFCLSRRPAAPPAVTKKNALAGGSDSDVVVAGNALDVPLLSEDTAGFRGTFTFEVMSQDPAGEDHLVARETIDFVPRLTPPIA